MRAVVNRNVRPFLGTRFRGPLVRVDIRRITRRRGHVASEISRNRADGSRNFGFATGLNGPVNNVGGNVFRNNRATNVGSVGSTPPFGLPPAGILVLEACNNTFFGNNLQGNFGDVGVIFPKIGN